MGSNRGTLIAIETGAPILAFFLVILFVGAIAYFVHLYNKKKEEQFRQFAKQNGLTYSKHPLGGAPSGCMVLGIPMGGSGWHGQFAEFSPFNIGYSQRASHIFEGTFEGLDWVAFQYQYTTGSGRNRTTHTYSIAVITYPMAFHETSLSRENILTSIGKVVGIRDIEFESEEFNRAFYVKCADKKFAYDLFHPRMMEFLLAAFRHNMQIKGTRMLVHQGGSLNLDFLISSKSFMQSFWTQIPDYLKSDYGGRPR